MREWFLVCCTIKRCLKEVEKNEKGFCLFKLNITGMLNNASECVCVVCVLGEWGEIRSRSECSLSLYWIRCSPFQAQYSRDVEGGIVLELDHGK